jgi:hypothetical protein
MKGFIIILGMALVIASTTGCSRVEESSEPNKQSQENIIGILASTTASFHVDASRECEIAGIHDLEQCSLNTGTLIQEKSAKILAATAMKQTKRYFAECIKNFPGDYCNDLIARAIQIEWRKPPASYASDPSDDDRGRDER